MPDHANERRIAMNLADFLCYADIRELSRIAESCGCDCDGHSKNELIQAILNTVMRREWMDRLAANLSTADLRLINSLLFEKKPGYSLEELTARAMQAMRDEMEDGRPDGRDLIASFRRRGWLFNGCSQKTRSLMQMPEDLKSALTAAIGRRFARALTRADAPNAYRDEHGLLQADVTAFLRFVRDNVVPLTADGVIYKRLLTQLLDGLSVKEEPLGRVGFRFGYGRKFRNYPDRFSFLYDYCCHAGLIAEEGGELALTDAGVRRLEAGGKEDLWQMVRFWLRLYRGPIPNVTALAYWTLYLTEDWVTAESLVHCLRPLVKPFYYDSPETVLEKRIIRMLMHLGLIRLGEHDAHGTVLKAHAQAPAILRRMADPDGEAAKQGRKLPARA
jgi:hypothetical protein